jgi:adenine specific DNA methylase Mod
MTYESAKKRYLKNSQQKDIFLRWNRSYYFTLNEKAELVDDKGRIVPANDKIYLSHDWEVYIDPNYSKGYPRMGYEGYDRL